MRRLATLLWLLAAVSSAEAREPAARVIYQTPAGPPAANPWTQHPVLSVPTPLRAVSDPDTTDGGNTAAFFARLTDLGFACLAFEPPRQRIRRAEVVCSRADGEEWFGYAVGWPEDGGGSSSIASGRAAGARRSCWAACMSAPTSAGRSAARSRPSGSWPRGTRLCGDPHVKAMLGLGGGTALAAGRWKRVGLDREDRA